MNNKEKISRLLKRRVEEIIVEDNLRKELLSGKKLRIKFGIDPTADILHLGHSVCLLKLREFQKMGHQVIFLIGDFTARIGDPTGRTVSRIPLSAEKIKENMKSYKKQAGLILDMDKVEVRYNSEWLDKINFREIMILASKVTYGQISARADFRKRLAEDKDFTLEEFMYPVLQGYDSVVLRADIEIGGTDQKFNMLMGRRIQKRYKQKPQNVITCPLLEGTDGKEKMSKSLGNYIAFTEISSEMYGKIMSIPDILITRYFELLTELDDKQIKINLNLGPRNAKAKLAKEIIGLYHGRKEAERAEQEFEKVFKNKEKPSDIPEIKLEAGDYNVLDLLVKIKLAPSKGGAKRLVEQGGVKINDKKIKDWEAKIGLKNGIIIQVGKRKFLKVKI